MRSSIQIRQKLRLARKIKHLLGNGGLTLKTLVHATEITEKNQMLVWDSGLAHQLSRRLAREALIYSAAPSLRA